MTHHEDGIDLVDRLRALPTESEWLEFKHNNANAQEIGEYMSALANEARLRGQQRGYLVFGIDDDTHEVVGTNVDPYTLKAKGNQDLLPWLASMLDPNPGVQPVIVDHQKGRVVVLAVGPAHGRPVTFGGKAYCRAGASKTELSKHPEKERALWMHGSDWSAEICRGATLADLDSEAIAKAREQFVIKHPSQARGAAEWDDLTFLNKAKLLKRSAVTNTALLLLGGSEAATHLAPAVAKISWILKDVENRELDYEHFGPPFILAGDRLLKRFRNLIVRALPSGTLFPQELTQYDPWVLREAVHNSIAHQDYRRHARIAIVELPDRVIVTNAGSFLPGNIRTVIEQDAPQLEYRNPFLADAMVELNMIDTQGGGIKRMFDTQKRRSFPLPDYDLADAKVSVSIFGRILDERYTRLLMEQPRLTITQVMLLDRVQKGLPIEHDEYRQLKAAGLVEGRYPSIMVSEAVAKATGQAAKHIRQRGFDKHYYVNLIMDMIRIHGPVSRRDVNELLISKLPERMNDSQKQRKVHNLLQELRRNGLIVNNGTRSEPRWMLGPDCPGG